MAEMSEKFKALGERVCMDADKVKESNKGAVVRATSPSSCPGLTRASIKQNSRANARLFLFEGARRNQIQVYGAGMIRPEIAQKPATFELSPPFLFVLPRMRVIHYSDT